MSAATSSTETRAGRRLLVLLLVCALSVFYLWLSLRSTDGAALREQTSRLRWPLIPVFVLCAALTLWARAARIALSLVRATPVSIGEAWRPMMAGYLTALLLPQPAGEIARISTATRDLRVTPAAAAASIAIERVLDLLIALIMVAAATPFAAHTDPRLAIAMRALSGFALLGTLLLTLAVVAPQRCRRLCEPLFTALPTRIGAWCSHHFDDLLNALQTLNTAHRALRYAALALLQTALWGSCIAVSLWAAGIDASPVAISLTTALFTLAMLLPAAPGYIGSMQLAYVTALVPLGVAQPQAFAASLFAHVLFNLFVLLTGIAVLRRPVSATR